MANKKTKVNFLCSSCGDDFPKWNGQCPSCKEWGTLSEFKILGKKKLVNESLDSQKVLIQKRIDRTTNQLGLLHESISQIHLDKTLSRKSSSLCDRMIFDLEKELVKLEDDRSNSVQEIKDLDNMSEWVEWVDLYGEDITNKLSDKTKTTEIGDHIFYRWEK